MRITICIALLVVSSGVALAQSRGGSDAGRAIDAGGASAATVYSIRTLRSRGPGAQPVTLETNSFRYGRVRCPPCPPRVNCTPCPTADILSDRPQPPADGSALGDTEIEYSFAAGSMCMQLQSYARYRLLVRPRWDAQGTLTSVEIARCESVGMAQ